MKLFSNLSLAIKLLLLGVVTSSLITIAVAVYAIGMHNDSKLFKEYVNHYATMDVKIEQIYVQGFQTEQATRNILIRPDDGKALENFSKAVKEFDLLFEKFASLAKDTPLAPRLITVRKAWDEGLVLKRQIIDLVSQGKVAEATEVLTEQETPKWREFKTANGSMSEILDKLNAAKLKEIESERSKIFIVILTVLLGTVACFSVSMGLIARGLKKRLQLILTSLNDIAHGEGDLTHRIAVTSEDELGKMAGLFNEAWDKLETITREVIEQTTCIEAYGGQLGIESGRIARGSKVIAMQSSAVATASEEMSATATDIARSCTVAAEAAANANQSATDGSAVLMRSVNAMGSIAEKVQDAAQTVRALGCRSEEIGAIVGTIEDIADQTNLLALNAAIEAARAGEQGRGFAVVADEVRALAERTTKATKEIADMIKNIQQETAKAVAIMEDGAGEVEKGITESARSKEALDTILSQISSLTMQVSQIATAAEEQSATTGEIVGNISGIITSVDGFTMTTQHMNGKVGQLQGAAETLKKSAATFKVNNSPLLMLDTAKSDHVAFVSRIARCLDDKESIQATTLPDHKNCRFGKWYFSAGKALCGSSRGFEEINGPHEMIHRIAKDAVDLHNKGMAGEAEHLLAQVEEISVEIVERLESIKKESLRDYA